MYPGHGHVVVSLRTVNLIRLWVDKTVSSLFISIRKWDNLAFWQIHDYFHYFYCAISPSCVWGGGGGGWCHQHFNKVPTEQVEATTVKGGQR